ncbi:MAG: sensor domain-containing diguanylate cyclase [Thermoleophilia bacterium]|jgi:diguanylate cyclase (GGDEF)-like protein
MSDNENVSRRRVSGSTIAGKILFANCAVVAIGAFAGTWITERYAHELSTFVLGVVFLTGGFMLCLPVNYLVVRMALKPLGRLAASMEQVQKGNMDACADLGAAADQQIARLATSFDTMLAWIRSDRETIEKLSLIDPLTEVGNTRALQKGLESEIARINRYGQNMPAAFSILILDIDKFKEINDTFGHLTGDCVLRDMAELLQKSLRKTDTALAALKHYRFGGDEFVIIAPHTSAEGARVLAERLDREVQEYPFMTHDGRLLRKSLAGLVRASIGHASYPEETTDGDELMDLADKRMYEVKQGRTRGKVLAVQKPNRLSDAHIGKSGVYEA